MKIIELTKTQYRNYSNIHSKRNFGQTIEYSLLKINNNKKKIFCGLIDNENNLHAAALILIHNITPLIKEAIAPNGYLIDYSNYELIKIFTKELKKFLEAEKVTYLITNPMYKHKVYNKNSILIENNENITHNFINLDYQDIGYMNDFERYDIIIENNNNLEEIYYNFNRNTKRNIKDALNMGITLYRGSKSELFDAYNIFKKKTNNSYEYYENLLKIYNSNDNKMEIYFAKLNPQIYLKNIKELYEIEATKNEKIHENISNNIGHITEKILNKKINSDKILEKYRLELNKAIILNQNTKEDIIIGCSIIIHNNHEVYFLIDGYKEEYRDFHTTHILKWAIIKNYYQKGYHIFNLGEIYKNYKDNNKYHGQYMYKIGFNGNIIEYPPNMLLVINKKLYKIHKRIRKI